MDNDYVDHEATMATALGDPALVATVKNLQVRLALLEQWRLRVANVLTLVKDESLEHSLRERDISARLEKLQQGVDMLQISFASWRETLQAIKEQTVNDSGG